MKTVLGIVRNWIQWNAFNGSTVTWGTDQILMFKRPLTVMDLEKLAVEIEEKLTASNSDYAKCSQEIFDSLFYNHDYSYKEKIESIIKKHFA